MEHVAIDDVRNEQSPLEVHSIRRPVSDALGTTNVAMNYFELDAGESFSGGRHTHHDQEEIFYVESGTATFALGRDGEEECTVEAGELVRFAPGEFQMGYNAGDETVRGWAIGAPGAKHDWSEIESIVHCRDCEAETSHGLEPVSGGFVLTCSECGGEFDPR